MSGQAGGLEALVTLLGFIAVLCIVFSVGSWWGDRKTARARQSLASYSTLHDRKRVGR